MKAKAQWHVRWARPIQSVLAVGILAWASNAAAQAQLEFPDLDVGYAPTPHAAVDYLLDMAEVGPDDTLVDLGSGDGRIVIAAVRDHGVKHAVGIDLDAWWQQLAQKRAREAGVEDRTEFIHGDLFEYDFYDASVITMYLLPEINMKLRPFLLEHMQPGTRIVSHTFDMGEWEPDEVAHVQRRDLFMWEIPARVEGHWTLHLSEDGPIVELDFEQKFQFLEGEALNAQGVLSQVEGRLAGNEVDLHFNGRSLSGLIGEDGVIYGTDGALWYAERDELWPLKQKAATPPAPDVVLEEGRAEG